MIQSILIATDFSENAFAATRSALMLARKWGAAVHLMHAYLPFNSAFQSRHDNEKDEERASAEAQEGLDRFVDALKRDAADVSLTSALVKANVKDAVEQYVTKWDIQLVVMGSHGNGNRSNLLGSRTYDVARAVAVPLLIVPQTTEGFDFNRIAFFTDYQPRDIETLQGFIELFGKRPVAECTLVHIHEKREEPTEEDLQQLESWKTMLESKTGFSDLATELVHAEEDVVVVNEIIDRLQPGLTLLTLVEGRKFFERLIHKSLARAIILQPKTPILLINRHFDEIT